MKLPKAAWVVVADGEKHLIFENVGTPMNPDLRVRAVERQDLAPNVERGTDRPGRYPGPGSSRREAVEQADWKRIDKEHFAVELGALLDRAAKEGELAELVLIADPRTLGALRPALGAAAKLVLAEIPSDFAHHTTAEIEAAIARH